MVDMRSGYTHGQRTRGAERAGLGGCAEGQALLVSVFLMLAVKGHVDARASVGKAWNEIGYQGDGNMGFSVTQRIKQVKQPRGGYVRPKDFKPETVGAGAEELNPEENVHASLVGMAVDYLTRFMSGASAEHAFTISIMGAMLIDESNKASGLVAGVRGLDNGSIVNALKLSGFDVCYRAGSMSYRPVDDINPDVPTIQNVRTMVERSLHFLEVYGPKVLDGFTFEGGYTDTVSKGDGDFTTVDTLWDFKVSRAPIKKEHTLQLLMYWRMGLHSKYPEFQDIRYLGIYNPRANVASRLAVSDVPVDVIVEVEHEVIGYSV